MLCRARVANSDPDGQVIRKGTKCPHFTPPFKGIKISSSSVASAIIIINNNNNNQSINNINVITELFHYPKKREVRNFCLIYFCYL